MLSAIDAPKSKSITIAFFAVKLMILGFIFIKQISSSGDYSCIDDMSQLITLYNIFFLASIIFDTFLLLYFYFTEKFGRLEYYIFYIFHIIFSVSTIIVTLSEIGQNKLCQMKKQMLGTCLLINVIFLTSSLVLMGSNLYFGLKFVHMGCNIIWTFIWLTEPKSKNGLFTAVAVIHAILSIGNIVSLNIMGVIKKTKTTASCWRYLYLLSIILMAICYGIAFVADTKSQVVIFAQVYKKVGWIQIIPPVLLLLFLQTQYGDPRQKIIRKDAKVFLKARQNQGFIQLDDEI